MKKGLSGANALAYLSGRRKKFNDILTNNFFLTDNCFIDILRRTCGQSRKDFYARNYNCKFEITSVINEAAIKAAHAVII